MQVDRRAGHAPRTTQLAKDVSQTRGPCIGCDDCKGLCAALLDALTVPDIVLGRTGEP